MLSRGVSILAGFLLAWILVRVQPVRALGYAVNNANEDETVVTSISSDVIVENQHRFRVSTGRTSHKVIKKEQPYATMCVYQGSSCEGRAKGDPGVFRSCNAEVEDNQCVNFPSAGAIYTCAANEKVNMYPIPGCETDGAEARFVGCVDMTVGTYFLLCCSENPNRRADLCRAQDDASLKSR